jgi:hypothetical protein
MFAPRTRFEIVAPGLACTTTPGEAADVGVALAVGVAVGAGVTLGAGVGVALGFGVPATAVGVGVGAGVTEAAGVGEAALVGVAETLAAGEGFGDGDAVAAGDAAALGTIEGTPELELPEPLPEHALSSASTEMAMSTALRDVNARARRLMKYSSRVGPRLRGRLLPGGTGRLRGGGQP